MPTVCSLGSLARFPLVLKARLWPDIEALLRKTQDKKERVEAADRPPAEQGGQVMQLGCGPCLIRSWRASDLEPLVHHANNRNVWLQLRDRFPHPYTIADGQAWLHYVSETRPETNFAIEVDGQAVGGIGLILGTDIERCSAELGYWLGPSVWGRGLATAAVRALTTYAFATYGIFRIFAVPFVENRASRRVLEKAGFVLEGVLRRSAVKDGRVIDQALYALVKEHVGPTDR